MLDDIKMCLALLAAPLAVCGLAFFIFSNIGG
jgi:hypothetical protein